MPLDGGFLYKLSNELKTAENAHIEKIYQPTKDELVFALRSPGFSKRLLISARPGSSRVCFTEARPENPETPPMFCMLLRKHLGSSRIAEISTVGLERILEITFCCRNEMGDTVYLKLIAELISANPNIIFIDQNSRIIDAVRRTTLDSGGRLILPGAVYEYPKSQEKADALSLSAKELFSLAEQNENMPLDKALLCTVNGLSPLVCRELAFKICDDRLPVGNLTSNQRQQFLSVLSEFLNELKFGGKPVLICNSEGAALDFSFIPITQYGSNYNATQYPTYSALLEAFYSKRDHLERLHRQSQDVLKLITNLISRIKRRMAGRINDLKKCEDREILRINGELLKANLYAVKPGQASVTVQNYYDEQLRPITIKLNPALPPAANAAKFFKDYKKAHTAEQTLSGLIKKDEEELKYLESVFDALSRAETFSDIGEIRDELAEAGYIRRPTNIRKKKPSHEFKQLTTPGGFKILIGKNNRQNDFLTLNMADKNDLWFHTKNIPGSHVILFCANETPSEEDIVFAATAAASNSKACASANIPVDYTRVKNVKKPAGAKPGMVIYTTNKTVYVTPIIGT